MWMRDFYHDSRVSCFAFSISDLESFLIVPSALLWVSVWSSSSIRWICIDFLGRHLLLWIWLEEDFWRATSLDLLCSDGWWKLWIFLLLFNRLYTRLNHQNSHCSTKHPLIVIWNSIISLLLNDVLLSWLLWKWFEIESVDQSRVSSSYSFSWMLSATLLYTHQLLDLFLNLKSCLLRSFQI